MTRACPSCASDVDEAARLCPSCGATVLIACPFCAEEIVALAKYCRWCKSDLNSRTGEPPAVPDPASAVVSERGIAALITMGLLTCGFYAFYVLHEQMKEIQALAGPRGRGLDPTRDLALAIASHFGTLGIFPFWIYYVMYAYTRAYQEACVAEEIPCRDVLTPCVLMAVMSTSLLCLSLAVPVWIFSIAVLQNELNHHVRLRRELGAVPA
ncbi:MAG TPA: hypothetical protein VGK43_05690 [Solirubrobacterales bacterium]